MASAMVRAVNSVAVAISMPVVANEIVAILFSSARFRRLAAVIRIGEQSFEQRGVHLSSTCALAIAVERRRYGIHHHVARSGVESDHVFWFRVGRNHGDVRDAADVERDACDLADAGKAR